jgi:hypothetical protein
MAFLLGSNELAAHRFFAGGIRGASVIISRAMNGVISKVVRELPAASRGIGCPITGSQPKLLAHEVRN